MEEVKIVDFDDKRHHKAFKELNERWIRDIFGLVEDANLYEIDHPVEHIINQGGFIFMAELTEQQEQSTKDFGLCRVATEEDDRQLEGKPVGCFAMMKSENPKYDYELVKFAVDPSIQHKGIGSKLIRHCIDKAKSLGAKHLFLESNHKNAAAVHLYEKFGFHHIPVGHSEYVRCDVQMEMDL